MLQIDIKKLSRSIQKKSRQVMDAQSRLRDLQDQNESLLDRLENIDAQNEAQINSIFTSCKAGSQATENMFSSFHSHHSSSQASELMVNSMCEENPGAHANEKFGVPRSLICEISGDDFLSTRTEFVQSGASSLHNVCTATGASVGECSANTPSGSLQQLVKQFRCDSRCDFSICTILLNCAFRCMQQAPTIGFFSFQVVGYTFYIHHGCREATCM